MKNLPETTELRGAGADDLCNEDLYFPLIPNQSSATTELLLECEEEELEPWQQQTSQVHFKDEEDVGELKKDQIECQLKPSPLQRTENAEPQQPRIQYVFTINKRHGVHWLFRETVS